MHYTGNLVVGFLAKIEIHKLVENISCTYKKSNIVQNYS